MSTPKKSTEKTITSTDEQSYRLLVEGVQDYAIYLLDTRGRVVTWNPGAERLEGYRPDEIIGRHYSHFFTPEDQHNKKPERLLRQAKAASRVEDEGWRVRKDGSRFWASTVITALRRQNGRLYGFAKVSRDRTEQRQAEVHIRKLNRTYALLSQVNQTIVRAPAPQALFEQACRIAVEQGGFRMAWIGLLNLQTGQIEPAAQAGLSGDYLEKLHLTPDDSPRGRGPTAAALRTGQHVVVNNIEHDPRMAPWREDALGLGYRASAALPLTVAGQVRGALNLYAAEPGFFDAEEISLLDEVARDIAFALEFTEQEAQRRQSEERFRATFEQAAVGIAHVAPDGRWLRVNQKLCDIVGYTRPELLAKSFQDITYPDDLETDLGCLRQVLADEIKTYTMEKRYFRQDGSLVWANLTVSLARTASGEPDYFISVVEDITGRKQAEATLRRSEASLALAQSLAKLGSWELDLDTETGFWSAEMFRLLERDPLAGPPTFMEFLEMIHPEDRRSLIEAHARLIETGGSLRLEFRRHPARGPERCFSTNLELVRDAAGRAVKLVGALLDITERKQAEQEREQLLNEAITAREEALAAKQLLTGVITRINDGFVALDNEWRYTYVNTQAAQMLQRQRPEDLLGKHIWTEYPEGVGQPFYHAYYQASQTQQPVYLEEYYEPWDRWFENRIYPSPDGLTIYFTEVTERKRAERALRKAEERLRMAVKAAQVGLWDWDLRIDQVYYSPEWKAQIGYADHEISNDFSEWQSRIHPDDLERSLQTVQAFIAKPWPNYQQEFRFRHKDGSYRWILTQASLLFDEQGKAVRMLGSHVDITGRKQAEEELRRQAETLREQAELLDHAHVLIRDTDNRIIFWNQGAEKLYGWTKEEAIGQVSHDLLQSEHPAPWEQIKARLWASGDWEGEIAHICKDGRRIMVASHQVLHRDEQGRPVSILEVNNDITERKQAEEALHRLNAELEERVALRTRELEAAMLKAQESDRLKSAFLATMSHELRTPLNSIIGFNGVLLQGLAGPLNEEQAKQLGMALNSARHLLALINDVLDISKIEAGQLEVACAPFDMHQAIETVLRSVTPQAQKKGLALLAGISSNVGVIRSDQRRVEQILLNLLSNAIKFTERGEVRLECRVKEGRLETSVRDTGIGVKPEDMDKLFKPFQQLETGLARRHEGTGLGLSICQSLVKLLGGEIRVESEWGVGSVFTFTLPLKT